MTDFRYWQEQAHPNVLCMICFEAKPREQMQPVADEPGVVWDCCLECSGRLAGDIRAIANDLRKGDGRT